MGKNMLLLKSPIMGGTAITSVKKKHATVEISNYPRGGTLIMSVGKNMLLLKFPITLGVGH